jgi:hypothetical protein
MLPWWLGLDEVAVSVVQSLFPRGKKVLCKKPAAAAKCSVDVAATEGATDSGEGRKRATIHHHLPAKTVAPARGGVFRGGGV